MADAIWKAMDPFQLVLSQGRQVYRQYYSIARSIVPFRRLANNIPPDQPGSFSWTQQFQQSNRTFVSTAGGTFSALLLQFARDSLQSSLSTDENGQLLGYEEDLVFRSSPFEVWVYRRWYQFWQWDAELGEDHANSLRPLLGPGHTAMPFQLNPATERATSVNVFTDVLLNAGVPSIPARIYLPVSSPLTIDDAFRLGPLVGPFNPGEN